MYTHNRFVDFIPRYNIHLDQNNKQLRVTATSACGTSALFIYYLVAQIPGTPAAISGPTNACTLLGGSGTYSVPQVAGAIEYLWTAQTGTTISYPNGTGVNSNTVSISFPPTFTTSPVTVQASNGCGASNARSLTIVRNAASTPGPISGTTNVCAHVLPSGTATTYSIALVSGATSYTWGTAAGSVVTHPNGAGANDNVITVKFPNGFTSGNIAVSATNGCGTSSTRSLAVNTLSPGTPGVIDVIQAQPCPNRVYTYTVSSMPLNATSVQWTVPVAQGAILVSGQGSTSITVSYPGAAVNGQVTATATNNCSSSLTRTTPVVLPTCPPPFARGAGSSKQSVTEINTRFEVMVSPNPTNHDFSIVLKAADLKTTTSIVVTDLSGRLIERKTGLPAGNNVRIGNHYMPGTYIAEFMQGNEKKIVKLIKL